MATEQPTGPDPDLMPTPPSGFPAPVPAGQRRHVTVIIAGLAGLAIGAAAVGGAWLLFGNNGASSSPISAPARISDYLQYGDAEVFIEDGDGAKNADRMRDWDARSSARLSEARDGAGAVVRSYTDDDIENGFVLEAVRAPSPRPYAAYSDPEYLGLELPPEEVREFGEVSCEISNSSPGQTVVLGCQRTSDTLTVRVARLYGEDLRDNAAEVAELVEAAWAELA